MKTLILLLTLFSSLCYAEIRIGDISIDEDGISIDDEDGGIFVGNDAIVVDDEDGGVFVDGDAIVIDDEDGGVFVEDDSVIIDDVDGSVVIGGGSVVIKGEGHNVFVGDSILKTADIIIKEIDDFGRSSVSINFASGSSKINKDSFKQISLIYDAISDLHSSFVLIGHTDNVGSEESNLTLSHDRANAVKSLLESKGYDRNLKIKGAGESTPVASNNTPTGRFANRRVEIRKID